MYTQSLTAVAVLKRWTSEISSRLSPILRRPNTDIPALAILWTFLSTTVSLACSYSFIHPYWIMHPDYIHSFGVYNYCYNHPKFYGQVCDTYGGHFSFSNLPSQSWQAACVLYGSGCLLMYISTVCACLNLCVTRPCDQRLPVIGGGLQITAALVLILGVVVFPLGTDSDVLQYYCGTAGRYNIGHCQLGWSYMLAIVASALAVFCPILTYFIDTGTHHKDVEVSL